MGPSLFWRNRRRPFFLYVPHLAIHFPWQGPRDQAYRVEGQQYHDLSKLGRLESKQVSAKVKEMVEAVDVSAGAIVRALEQHGLTENTLVFFTSDNGGYLTYEGGYHHISSNGPLRGQKTDVYEGGHRVPALAWWPGRIRRGVVEQTAMTFDLFPTFAALAGATALADLDGLSLTPVLCEGQPLASRPLFWRMREKKAVRHGDWKLVVHGKQEPELYNLREDIGETRNRARAQPERRSRLLEELARWEADVDRRPLQRAAARVPWVGAGKLKFHAAARGLGFSAELETYFLEHPGRILYSSLPPAAPNGHAARPGLSRAVSAAVPRADGRVRGGD